jgi:hypothetical protein
MMERAAGTLGFEQSGGDMTRCTMCMHFVDTGESDVLLREAGIIM